MGSQTLSQVAPTPDTIALNAAFYGYAGHSLVTPHVALKQIWWTDARIEAKVTRQFVLSRLRAEEREIVNRPLAYGEGLTDDTYMEWILTKARRLFLILAEIGVPDQIFGCVDDSWDDEDLPVARENVATLELSYENDEALNRKFYDAQFIYLLRELTPGSHLDYTNKELIPMERAHLIPPAATLQTFDRVHFPGKPHEIYMRRKYSLCAKDAGRVSSTLYMRDIRRARALAHEHIAPVWASYTSKDSGYVLSDFVAEHTLASFIQYRTPAQIKTLSASRRRVLLCEWMHCLADAIAFLHHCEIAHTAIRPSNVWIDSKNRIAFGDVGSLRTFQKGKRTITTEVYDYTAPELHVPEPSPSPASPSSAGGLGGAFNILRKRSLNIGTARQMSLTDHSVPISPASSGTSSPRKPSVATIPPLSVLPIGRSYSFSTATPSFSSIIDRYTSSDKPRTGPTHRHLPRIHTSPNLHNLSNDGSAVRPFSRESTTSSSTTADHGDTNPSPKSGFPPAQPVSLPAADIFSLGCLYLDILSFLLKGKLTDFVKFRRANSSTSPATSPLGRSRIDSSFHGVGFARLDAWMTGLEEDSRRQLEQERKQRPKPRSPPDGADDADADESVLSCIPALLRLVRMMLSWDPAQRPSAVTVRTGLRNILTEQGNVHPLCCDGRLWAFRDTLDASPSLSPRDSVRQPSDPSSRMTMEQALDLSPKTTAEQALDLSPKTTAEQALDLSPKTTAAQALDLSPKTTAEQALDLSPKTTAEQAFDLSPKTTMDQPSGPEHETPAESPPAPSTVAAVAPVPQPDSSQTSPQTGGAPSPPPRTSGWKTTTSPIARFGSWRKTLLGSV